LSLKWLLRILNFLMRCSKVEGATQSLAAAPSGPDTRPRLPASASSMICRSRLASSSASAGSGCCGKLTRRESLDNQAASTQNTLWHRLLGRPVSESGRLCHGNGGQEGGDRYRRVLMLAILSVPLAASTTPHHTQHALRSPTMSRPFIFVSTNKVREGERET